MYEQKIAIQNVESLLSVTLIFPKYQSRYGEIFSLVGTGAAQSCHWSVLPWSDLPLADGQL